VIDVPHRYVACELHFPVLSLTIYSRCSHVSSSRTGSASTSGDKAASGEPRDRSGKLGINGHRSTGAGSGGPSDGGASATRRKKTASRIAGLYDGDEVF